MKVRDEIAKFSAEDDKPALLWLFSKYHMESTWLFVARCTFQRYGYRSYESNRVWAPRPEGRILYAAHIASQETVCASPGNAGSYTASAQCGTD